MMLARKGQGGLGGNRMEEEEGVDVYYIVKKMRWKGMRWNVFVSFCTTDHITKGSES
jgi:hypothetical protein